MIEKHSKCYSKKCFFCALFIISQILNILSPECYSQQLVLNCICNSNESNSLPCYVLYNSYGCALNIRGRQQHLTNFKLN